MSDEQTKFDRRRFIRNTGLLGLTSIVGAKAVEAGDVTFLADDVTYGKEFKGTKPVYPTVEQPFGNGTRQLVSGYPGKRPLIRLTTRPPQLETPFSAFNEGVLTPNDAFYVRYHGAPFPAAVDANAFRLSISGNVNRSLSLSINDLKTKFPQHEVVAVCQCSGNGRGYSQPRVKGGQYANGAMGNARWTGVLLKDVLEAAGVRAGSVQIAMNGLDAPSEDGPDFVKALNMDHVLDTSAEVMLAYNMNGTDLPLLNGFPLRVVVPGHYATYWVKHVNKIDVRTTPLDSFYMTTAYRIPDNSCACVPPGENPTHTVPINRLNVRSFFTSLSDGSEVLAGYQTHVKGIAFDGGSGIRSVLVSEDGGLNWNETTLSPSLGRFSFQEWTYNFTPTQTGLYKLKVKAISNTQETQPDEALWNPSGYMRNVIEAISVTAV